MTYLKRVDDELTHIREQNRYREVGSDEETFAADFSTNDYLALSTDSRMIESLRVAKRVGSGGSRLLGGRNREHRLLEEDLARWTGRERALLFSSGYLAALGAVQVLSTLVSTIYSDALNHASLIDGIKVGGLPREIYEHAHVPPGEMRCSPALVVTESYFGMDGNEINVAAIVRELGADDILLVDEAHALGVFGREGAGLARELEDDRVVILGTLSKAVGAAGGFVAGPAKLVDLLVNTARTFIYDTALPPPIAFAARVGVMLARTADDARTLLFAKADRLREGLRTLGLAVPESRGPIVPVIFGSEEAALDAMRRCAERGVRAPAIRPPTVPAGTSRLRLSVRADHTDAQIDLLLDALVCAAIS